MNNITKIHIRSLWIGTKLSPIERLSINSYLRNGHEIELYVYENIKNIPNGVIIKDANQIIPASELFSITLGSFKNSYAIFADYFRYKLLFEKGGWWSDLDVVCLKPYNLNQDFVFSTEKNKNNLDSINNAIFKCPPFAPIMQYCYEEVKKMIDSSKIKVWGQTGPALLRNAVIRYDLVKYSLPSSLFAPIGYYEIDKLFSSRMNFITACCKIE